MGSSSALYCGERIFTTMALGTVYLEITRDYYVPVETTLTITDLSTAALDIELQPSYTVGDVNGDGFPDALDLARMIDILFAGSTDWTGAYWSADMDFDRFFTAIDLSLLIDMLYAGGEQPGVGRCWP